jgi:hypothetical protein
VGVDIRRHQSLAVYASVLLVPLMVVWLSESAGGTPVLVDIVFLGILAGLFLIPFSWVMRVAVPNRAGLRIFASVSVLLLLAFATAVISVLWVTRQAGGRLWPE